MKRLTTCTYSGNGDPYMGAPGSAVSFCRQRFVVTEVTVVDAPY